MINKSNIKKHASFIVNLVILVILGFVLYKKIPTIYNNYTLENSKLENISLQPLSAEEISIPDIRRNKIIVFWATWCPACRSELQKLNDMLTRGEIKSDDVIAISLDEKIEDVAKFIEQENYRFLVAYDYDGRLARKFKISATPTVIFVNKNSNIDWVSTGISPLLGKRVKEFLKN